MLASLNWIKVTCCGMRPLVCDHLCGGDNRSLGCDYLLLLLVLCCSRPSNHFGFVTVVLLCVGHMLLFVCSVWQLQILMQGQPCLKMPTIM